MIYLRKRPPPIDVVNEILALLLAILDDPSLFSIGQWMMTPGTIDSHLTTFTREEGSEAESKIVSLLGSVPCWCDLAITSVDESLAPGFALVHDLDTIVVAA